MSNKNTLTTEEFINRAIKIHGDKYNYTEVTYRHNKTNIKIYCNTCDIFFYQSPNKHLSGRGCKVCGINKRTNKLRHTKKQMIEKCIKTHGNKYNYTKIKYTNAQTKVPIICNKHGVFHQTLAHHIYSNNGCPDCNSSKGETKTEKILQNLSIEYNTQHIFNNCKNIKPLPFDFYLPKQNICIEYDGEFHYHPARYSKDKDKMIKKLNECQHRDSIKTKFCEDNGIKLIRIPYTEFDNIESILESKLN